MTTAPDASATSDAEAPSSARIYDYALGGKDNYEIDRTALEKVMEAFPTVRIAARHNRQFMHRAIGVLAEAGVRQFLDIGTGIPTEPNLHQVAQRHSPEARVVYVDNDPVVLAHARALLAGSPEGRTAFVAADLNDPEAILAAQPLHDTLDLSSPVALSLVAVLHFLTDAQDPAGVLKTLLAGLAPGSFVVASHITSDLEPEAMDRAFEMYRQNAVHVQARTREEFTTFFDGLELLDPGIVTVNRWRPGIEPPSWLDAQVNCYGAVARKP
ncbi:O-methyltransferase involved in polyketide biosynthesis [Nocardia nova SH22a]|uniref:O-methyltransferase involved in polyketide biosynthesis n=1 Tax=Nocardia nova SH22a TaxID=1415166 RepID=W5TDN2_9NOCA|nr:SAM-dependent methyltransferase [Nocardia nova]AHH17342.1 O-methyltransferase involved in polyketide biosynthesis [Nocardia nova SH22a]